MPKVIEVKFSEMNEDQRVMKDVREPSELAQLNARGSAMGTGGMVMPFSARTYNELGEGQKGYKK